MRGGVGGVGGWHGLDRRVRHVENQRMGTRCGGVTQRGKGDEPFSSSRGLEFLPSCSPIWQALVKTIPQLLVTLQIQLPFPLWREWEWEAIQIDRTQREKERRVLNGLDRCRGQLSGCAILISYEGCLAVQAHRLVWFCVCALQQRPLQRLNEELVNMHEGRTLPFTLVTSGDALAQRKMGRNGTSKTLNSYLYPILFCFHCLGNVIKLFDSSIFLSIAHFADHSYAVLKSKWWTCQNIYFSIILSFTVCGK